MCCAGFWSFIALCSLRKFSSVASCKSHVTSESKTSFSLFRCAKEKLIIVKIVIESHSLEAILHVGVLLAIPE